VYLKGTELVDGLRPQPPPFKIIIFSECFGDPVTVSPKGAEEVEITPLQFSDLDHLQ
jgi:hypothetical protein